MEKLSFKTLESFSPADSWKVMGKRNYVTRRKNFKICRHAVILFREMWTWYIARYSLLLLLHFQRKPMFNYKCVTQLTSNNLVTQWKIKTQRDPTRYQHAKITPAVPGKCSPIGMLQRKSTYCIGLSRSTFRSFKIPTEAICLRVAFGSDCNK